MCLKRRLGWLGLAVWYALVSTSLVSAGLDLVTPLNKRVAALDFPCAHHDCGCQIAEQCRSHCCCHPGNSRQLVCHLPASHEATPQHAMGRVSRLSVARCHGHSQDDGVPDSQKLAPHLPVTEGLVRIVERPRRRTANGSAVVASAFRDPPEKIPL